MLLNLHYRFAVDLVVCVALGCDMFDCVYPTRTGVSRGIQIVKMSQMHKRMHIITDFTLKKQCPDT